MLIAISGEEERADSSFFDLIQHDWRVNAALHFKKLVKLVDLLPLEQEGKPV